MTIDQPYDEKLKEEALFWGHFEEDADRYGIPWWCDLRRATKLSKVILDWMYDPRIEDILRGKYKASLIEQASRKGGKVLDIGCGAGWLSLELARRGLAVDGYDCSQKRIDIARRFLDENPFKEGFGSIEYRTGDINNLDWGEEKYDSVVCWDSLHHVADIDGLIEKVHKCLKTGGTFYAYDHIGLQTRNTFLIGLLLIPFYLRDLLDRLFTAGRAKGGAQVHPPYQGRAERPPFEDATGYEMVPAIKKRLEVIISDTQLCFLAVYASRLLGLPDRFKYPFLRALKALDDALIRMRLLKGEYVFIVARKGR
jgi:SAM-dependent methyltransferase